MESNDADDVRHLLTPCPMCGRIALHDTDAQRDQVAARRFIRHMFTLSVICLGFTVVSLSWGFVLYAIDAWPW